MARDDVVFHPHEVCFLQVRPFPYKSKKVIDGISQFRLNFPLTVGPSKGFESNHESSNIPHEQCVSDRVFTGLEKAAFDEFIPLCLPIDTQGLRKVVHKLEELRGRISCHHALTHSFAIHVSGILEVAFELY